MLWPLVHGESRLSLLTHLLLSTCQREGSAGFVGSPGLEELQAADGNSALMVLPQLLRGCHGDGCLSRVADTQDDVCSRLKLSYQWLVKKCRSIRYVIPGVNLGVHCPD